MDSSILLQFRDGNGYISLDRILGLVEEKMEQKGRRIKKWYCFDDIPVLFKETSENTYEDYAELLLEEIFRQVGAKTAHYDLACLGGKKGVITPDFRGAKGKSISGKSILENYGVIIAENNGLRVNNDFNFNVYNNLVDIEKALSYFNLSKEEIAEIMGELDLLFAIDCITLQTDRHWNNWSQLIIPGDKVIRTLAPQYDGGAMCRFQVSTQKISRFLKNFQKTKKDSYRQRLLETDLFPSDFDPSSLLRFDSSNLGTVGMQSFEIAYRKAPERFRGVVERLKLIDTSAAIAAVESRTSSKIPLECKQWFESVIGFSKTRMERIVEDVEQERGI